MVGVPCGSNDGSSGRVLFFSYGPQMVTPGESTVYKNICLTVCVSLSELGHPETHEKLSIKRLSGSINEKQGEKLLLSCRHWARQSGLAKNRHPGKIQLKRVNHGRSTRHRHGDSARPPAALRKVWFSTALSKKKQKATSWIVERFC